MKVYVLHLFVDRVLSETRAFDEQRKARDARSDALERVGVGTVDGEVVDVNGSVWSAAIESVIVE